MCGICGILTFDRAASQPETAAAVQRMTDLMFRRGPDDEGLWLSPDERARFGFRRLAILDLTQAGHQPMLSGDGRSAIVFNGEVYNFQDIRRELEAQGVQFRSRTDTEVVLEALNCWGIDALRRLNGMFALAWYNLNTREMLLARDHAGIKPLYYFIEPHRRGIAFASQYNSLLHTPWGEPGEMRLEVLNLYMRLHHIPPPYALFENTYQLEPGHCLRVLEDGMIHKQAWWGLPRQTEISLTGDNAIDALEAALHDAVNRQRIADVPLGVFLSGGVDSPLVTAIARQQTDPSLKAFTIGNPGWDQDEAAAASAYARHLDVDHRIHNIDGLQAMDMLYQVISAQTEPFGDYSIFPTLMVSAAARTELTVALSGDGGDELFWGYTRPLSLLKNGSDFRYPHLIRKALYGAGRYGLGRERSAAIVARTPGEFYFEVNSRLREADLKAIAPDLPGLPPDFTLYQSEPYRDNRQLAYYSRWAEFYGQLQRGLKKVDMASMYHSLEVRVPLLDRVVIELSYQLDPFEAIQDETRKAHLRKVLARYVPKGVIPEVKRGFAVPLDEWLVGDLRPLIEDVLLSGDTYPSGLFNQKALRDYCDPAKIKQGYRKWGIWTLLALQLWHQQHYPFQRSAAASSVAA